MCLKRVVDQRLPTPFQIAPSEWALVVAMWMSNATTGLLLSRESRSAPVNRRFRLSVRNKCRRNFTGLPVSVGFIAEVHMAEIGSEFGLVEAAAHGGGWRCYHVAPEW